MATKRKLPGEDFVLKAEESTEVTRTVSLTIPDFSKSESKAFIRRNKQELKEMDLTSYPPKVINEVVRLLI